MNKKTLIIMLAMTLLIFSACEEGEDTNNRATGFAGGTKGIEAQFVTNAPPTRVADAGQEPFTVQLELTNMGEHHVLSDEAFVQLRGFSASAFGVTNQDLIAHPEDDLYPVRKSPDGSIISPPKIPVVFEGFNYQQHEITNLPFKFSALTCYKYETIAVSNICVKENFNDDRPGDLCRVSGQRQVSNSGAPVQITNIRQAPQGRDATSITLSIQQKSTDGGKVSRPDSSCSNSQQDENRVFVSVTGLEQEQGDMVRCIGLLGGDTSSGFVTLSGNEPREISCTVQLEDRNLREESFRVTLGYDYSIITDTTVNVVPSYE